MYGGGHAVARRSSAKAAETLAHTLELQVPLALHFTKSAVFCGDRALARSHPIYRTFAERLWKLGVAAVTFHGGAGEEDLVRFIDALSAAAHEHATRERAEELLRGAGLERIEVRFLHEVVAHSTEVDVQPLAPGEAEKQWERLIGELAALAMPASESTGLSGERQTPSPDADSSPDYAAAVIRYLKQLQRSQQQEAVLQETGFGQQLSALLGSISPELRRQLVAAAVVSPEMNAETLHRLVNAVGHDHLLAALQRLNDSGHTLPPTALRTLSMLALMRKDPVPDSLTASGVAAAGAAQRRTEEELQAMLDQLLGDEQAERYTSEEYERTLREAEQRAQRVVKKRGAATPALALPPVDGERHFLLVGRQLLAGADGDVELANGVCREGQRSWARFAESADPVACAEAMLLAREALEASGRLLAGPWLWETPEMLDRLRRQLVEGNRVVADATGEVMIAVGAPAVPVLVDVLATSPSLSVRRRALAVLETLDDNPCEELTALLVAEHPWYLQRNAAFVLRRRRDPVGAAAAKALWRHADPRVKLELVGYLLAIGDPERLRFLGEALADRDPEQATAVARAVLREPTEETVAAVLRRAEQVPNDQVGMPFHLALLRALAASKVPQAVRYVAELPQRRRPFLPWQRERYRKAIAAMVAEAS